MRVVTGRATRPDPRRPEIASSWLRSRLSGVNPSNPPHLDFSEGFEGGSLAAAAGPVLLALSSDLADAGAGVLLADSDARITDVRAAENSVRDWMAALGAVRGARFGEDNAGTNAIGTPLEVQRCMSVLGDEHFHEQFKNFSCHGEPIHHPVTRRTVGVLDICYQRGADNPLFRALARRVVGDIAEQLLVASPKNERALAAAFSSPRLQGAAARIALGNNSIMATPAALDMLHVEDHIALRAQADDVLRGKTMPETLTLGNGTSVKLKWNVIEGASGVVVALTAPIESNGLESATTLTDDMWPALLSGEHGSGRTARARALLHDSEFLVLDGVDSDSHRHLRRRMEAAFRKPNHISVLLENVHLLNDSDIASLAGRLDRPGRNIVMTCVPGRRWDDIKGALIPLIGRQETLTSLRERRDEIPRIAMRMLHESANGNNVRFAPASLRALASQPWPGNMAELRRLVEVVAQHSTGEVSLSDLPCSYRHTYRPLSPRHEAEREAIVTAIAAAEGNRTRAAIHLGVSRSTLYNRMRILDISN